jgi:hypothetical protein
VTGQPPSRRGVARQWAVARVGRGGTLPQGSQAGACERAKDERRAKARGRGEHRVERMRAVRQAAKLWDAVVPLAPADQAPLQPQHPEGQARGGRHPDAQVRLHLLHPHESPRQALTRGILWLSFGAPERPEDLWEFLERVTRGRNVPRERLAVVREQYLATGGASPLNRQNLELIERLGAALATRGFEVPIYFGNRNWDPLVADTVRTMHADGITDALVIPTSAFSSYSGCRQYREDLAGAHAPFATLKLQPYGTLPAYREAVVDALTGFLDTRGLGSLADTVVFTTAHSIPVSMAEASRYVPQLEALTEGKEWNKKKKIM